MQRIPEARLRISCPTTMARGMADRGSALAGFDGSRCSSALIDAPRDFSWNFERIRSGLVSIEETIAAQNRYRRPSAPGVSLVQERP